jgi:hypothetical protein
MAPGIFDVWVYPRSNFNMKTAGEKCLIASFVGARPPFLSEDFHWVRLFLKNFF